jgi:hypothetical protein
LLWMKWNYKRISKRTLLMVSFTIVDVLFLLQ